jgi:hypothetical protein
MGALNPESHRTLGGLGSEKSANRVEYFPDLPVVLLIPFFQFFEAAGQVLMRCQEFAQFDESTHDRDVHLNCPIALEHAREHRNALFGKYEGQITAAAPT